MAGSIFAAFKLTLPRSPGYGAHVQGRHHNYRHILWGWISPILLTLLQFGSQKRFTDLGPFQLIYSAHSHSFIEMVMGITWSHLIVTLWTPGLRLAPLNSILCHQMLSAYWTVSLVELSFKKYLLQMLHCWKKPSIMCISCAVKYRIESHHSFCCSRFSFTRKHLFQSDGLCRRWRARRGKNKRILDRRRRG